MLIYLGVSVRDSFAAVKLLQWIAHFNDDLSKHKLVLTCAKDVDCNNVLLHSPFQNTEVFHLLDSDESGWPMSPNFMFKRSARRVKNNEKEPFLWLEPDSIPIKAGWIDKIQFEYQENGKLWMGDRCEALPEVKEYMSGIGVYHQDAFNMLPLTTCERAPWDIVSHDAMSGNIHFCQTIQHVWKDSIGRVPTWKDKLCNVELREGAYLFHRCKDGSIYDFLTNNTGAINVGKRRRARRRHVKNLQT
jgi:hypothetical protein